MGKKIAPQEAKARAAVLKDKATKMALTADFTQVKSLLTEHLDFAPDVLEYLQGLILNGRKRKATKRGGEKDSNSDDKDKDQGASSTAAAAPDATMKQLALTNGELGIGSTSMQQGEGSPRVIDRRNSTLESLPVKDLKFLCSGLEKVSMSPFALKGLTQRGQRECSQRALCESIEFATGIDPRQGLDHRAWQSMEDLLAFLQELNEERGRRARDLVMPPQWPKNGTYKVESRNGLIVVVNKFTGAVFLLPAAMQGFSESDYSLEANFFEARAQVICKDRSAMVLQCEMVLPASESGPLAVSTPESKGSRAVSSPRQPAGSLTQRLGLLGSASGGGGLHGQASGGSGKHKAAAGDGGKRVPAVGQQAKSSPDDSGKKDSGKKDSGKKDSGKKDLVEGHVDAEDPRVSDDEGLERKEAGGLAKQGSDTDMGINEGLALAPPHLAELVGEIGFAPPSSSF